MRMRVARLATGLLIAAASCAAPTGPPVEPAHPGELPARRALVYVYRPASLIAGAERCNVRMNNAVAGGLGPGQYTYAMVKPGHTRFEGSDTDASFVTVILEPGHEYFIRETWLFDQTGLHSRLQHIPKVRALREMARCTYVESPPVVEKKKPEEKGDRSAEKVRALPAEHR
jgi:hypothetical protein